MEKLDWIAGELVLEHQKRSCCVTPSVAFKQAFPELKEMLRESDQLVSCYARSCLLDLMTQVLSRLAMPVILTSPKQKQEEWMFCIKMQVLTKKYNCSIYYRIV